MRERFNGAGVRDEAGAFPVVALLIMAAISMVLSAGLYAAVLQMDTDHNPPWVTFRQDSAGGTLRVVAARPGTLWEELTLEGCTDVPASGDVKAGQLVKGCGGSDVRLVHTPSGMLLSTYDFTR